MQLTKEKGNETTRRLANGTNANEKYTCVRNHLDAKHYLIDLFCKFQPLKMRSEIEFRQKRTKHRNPNHTNHGCGYKLKSYV